MSQARPLLEVLEEHVAQVRIRRLEAEVAAMDPAAAGMLFADAGVMTNDAGLVVKVGDREFQVTVVVSR